LTSSTISLQKGELKVAIEIQSTEYHEDPEKDQKKKEYLEGCGYSVVYVDTSEVISHPWYADEKLTESLGFLASQAK